MNNEFKKSKSNNETRYTLESMTAGATGTGSIDTAVTAASNVHKRSNNLLTPVESTEKKVDATKPRNFVAKNAKMGGAGKMKDKSKTIPRKEKHKKAIAEGFNGEYDDEAGMAHSNLLTTARAVMGLLKTIKDRDNLPEWGQEKIAKAEMMLVSVWDYLQSQKQMGNDPQVEAYGRYDRRDAYQRDYDSSVSGMDRGNNHRDDERHDLDPSDWYIVKDGKMYKTSVYPRQEQEALSRGYSRTREEAKAKAEQQGVAEGPNDGTEDNFTIDDIKRLERIRDLETLKAQAKELIKGKPARRMKPEKISWFYNHIDTLRNPLAVIKMMYDLMLAGEGHKVIGSRNSMSSNSYRTRFGEQDMAEGERTMSRAAKGHEKYGKAGMAALAKAGRDGAGEEKLDAIRDKHDKYNEGVADGLSKRDQQDVAAIKAAIERLQAQLSHPNADKAAIQQSIAHEKKRLALYGEQGVAEVAGPEKCWPGHRKVGTKPGTGKNAGKRVNDCEKIGEAVEDRTSYQVAKILSDRGIKYDPAQENELINAIGMVLVKELMMSPKQARYLISYDEDFVSDTLGELRAMENAVSEVAPPGWEKTVKAMKKHDEIDNPFALAWSMKNKGYKSHKKESADPYFESLRARVEELAKK